MIQTHKTKAQRPLRVLVYATGGVGKSTFASRAPHPVFLASEDGLSQIDTDAVPEPKNWSEALATIAALTTEDHPFQTLVIDSVDWLEPLCWAHTCALNNKRDIEAFGFGKGYVAALEQWRKLIAALDEMRKQRGMHIVLIAHEVVKTYKNPTGEDYDRHTIKLHDKSAALLREWCDGVFYAQYETVIVELNNRNKGVSTGKRIMHTQGSAAFDAKNRWGLPSPLAFEWSELWKHVRGVSENAELLRKNIRDLAGTKWAATAENYITQANDNLEMLSEIYAAVAVKVAEQGAVI